VQKTNGHIAIIGGGTAGWLAALMLQKAASAHEQPQPRISVIESPNIPTVGVGEGSTSVFRQVLFDLGIDELEFLRETGATIKFGIRHAGWRRDRKAYLGPIDDPNALTQPHRNAPSNWLHHARIRAGKSASGAHLFSSLMNMRKAPVAKSDEGLIPLSPFHHAYHFDQARLGKFLARKATGIEHILTEVESLERDESTGHIKSLNCSDDQSIPVDFVIDCTGFRRAIIGGLGATWHSYSSMLPLNKAMPFWLKHDSAKDMAPFTDAQALDAGWMWSIPLQDRTGCGYVFSDAHVSPEQAQAEVEAHLRCKIEPRGLISIDPGRLDKAWIGNCVAMGLSQSFLEPLEATSIHGTIVQALILTSEQPSSLVGGEYDQNAESYNKIVAQQVDDFADFINIHYAGGRTDSEFWRDVSSDGIAQRQRVAIEKWQTSPMISQDFEHLPWRLPHVEEQLYLPVLDGLGLLPKSASKSAIPDIATVKEARKLLEKQSEDFGKASRQAMGHREYLEFACNS